MAEQKPDWKGKWPDISVLTGPDRALLMRVEFLAGLDLTGLNLAGLPLPAAEEAIADRKERRHDRCEDADEIPSNIDLSGTILRNVDLSDVNLTYTKGLAAEQLAGAALQGAILPEGIVLDKGFEYVDKAAENAGKLLVGLLTAFLFVWLTIATTTDAGLISNNSPTKLPVIGADIPIAGFYQMGPLVLTAVYVDFLLYLQRLWEGLAVFPAVFPDGRPLDKRVTPWLLNGLIRSHMPRLREQEAQPPMVWLQWLLCLTLAWAVVPFTLLLLWARYLVAHDPVWTTVHVILLAVNLGAAIQFYQLAKSTLRGEWQGRGKKPRVVPQVWQTLPGGRKVLWRTQRKPAQETAPAETKGMDRTGVEPSASPSQPRLDLEFSAWRDPRPRLSLIATAWGLAGALLFGLLSCGAIRGVRPREELAWLEPPKELGDRDRGFFRKCHPFPHFPPAYHVRRWVPRMLRVLGNSPFADLRQAELSVKVKDGKPEPGSTVPSAQGAHLQGRNLNYADASQAVLIGADLQNASLCQAKLWRADLRQARLWHTDLRGADLREADLSGAIFTSTNDPVGRPDLLRGARLDRARLRAAQLPVGTDLRESSLVDAVQVGAYLKLANIELASLYLRGALPRYAHLECADLGLAHLERANLADAYLEFANLAGARLAGAHLEGAHLRFANLAGANLEGAYLGGANLAGANLAGANLVGGHLERTHLQFARLPGAILAGANLAGARLGRADLENADLDFADLENADLERADLGRADLTVAYLAGACLGHARLAGARLAGAQYSADTQWPVEFYPKKARAKLVQRGTNPKRTWLLLRSLTAALSYTGRR